MTHPNLKFTFILIIFLFLSGQSFTVVDLDRDLKKSSLIVSTSKKTCYLLSIWVAHSIKEKARGLMYVRNMPEQSGMLFVYTESDQRSMWMKNTYIPLDIIFIKNSETISSIARNTEPLSLKNIRSTEPVNYVLEINAGMTKKMGIVPNDKVFWFDSLIDAL
ncbi:uncharacterized protein METZ01_LOCUS45337 [marine metagenome]|uniref:DUF192 domain-containing protein n=1 Tax=marine metagenome TaxID=408172 RepID=A0A381RU93_9ZZZZ